jgi:hypothetical protein
VNPTAPPHEVVATAEGFEEVYGAHGRAWSALIDYAGALLAARSDPDVWPLVPREGRATLARAIW